MPSRSMPEHYNTDLDWQERALHYGDGLFETLLKFDNDLRHWEAHFDRLRRGCDRLSIAVPDEGWLRARVDEESQNDENTVIKIIVSRGRGGRGLKLPAPQKASAFILCYPWTQPVNRELKVAICETRLPLNPSLAGLKHLNRLDYVLASLELQHQAVDEGILCDTEGYLVEGVISNLFFVDQGRLFTPSLEFAGVDGIMRQLVLEQLEKMKLPISVGRYPPQRLFDASECFLCNSVRGISPVVAVGQKAYTSGEITHSLIAALNISAVTL